MFGYLCIISDVLHFHLIAHDMSKQRRNILPKVYPYTQYDTLCHITIYFVGYFILWFICFFLFYVL